MRLNFVNGAKMQKRRKDFGLRKDKFLTSVCNVFSDGQATVAHDS